MEVHSPEIGTHNGSASTMFGQPSSEEFPQPTVMTSAAMASATPTPIKRNSANKRPQKRARDYILSPSLINSTPDTKVSNTKVSSSNTSFCSKYLEEYKTRVFVEFKQLFKRKKQAKNTHNRMLNLYSHELTPNSLRIHPPKLKIDHEEINNSMHKDFLTLTNQYNKDLTSTYIKHLDLLVHSYTKTLDNFPNTVRSDLHNFANILQEPQHFEDVSSYVEPANFQETINTLLQDFGSEILKMCDDFALNHNIDDTLKRTATELRDKTRAQNRYENPNIRDIDITMYEGEEENDNEMFYDSPSYIAPVEAEINNTKNSVPHTINLNKNSNHTPTPNPKKNLNFTLNPNPEPKSNPNTNSNSKNTTNPFPNSHPNPNHRSNNNSKQAQRPRHRASNLLFTCNTATNEVKQAFKPYPNHGGPQVLFHNPNFANNEPHHSRSPQAFATIGLGHLPAHISPPAPNTVPELHPPYYRQPHLPNISRQQFQHSVTNQSRQQNFPPPPPPLLRRTHGTPYNNWTSQKRDPLHNNQQHVVVDRGLFHQSFPPPIVNEYGTVLDSHLVHPSPSLHGALFGTAQGSQHTFAPPLLPTPHPCSQQPHLSRFQNPNYSHFSVPSSHPPLSSYGGSLYEQMPPPLPSPSQLFPYLIHAPALLPDNLTHAPPLFCP